MVNQRQWMVLVGIVIPALVLAGCKRETPNPGQAPSKVACQFREVLLGRIPTNVPLGELKISPDNGRIACSLLRSNRWNVFLDGAESGPYDEVHDLLFSPDSRHLVFAARLEKETWVYRDGQRGKAYQSVGGGCIVFSPDSQHLAYIAQQNGKWLAVVDGQEGKPYDRIGRTGLKFSPDGKRLVYSAIQKEDCFMVVDGQEGPLCDGMGPFSFSDDSRHTAYVVPRGEKSLVVLDGSVTEYDLVLTEGVLFSPDGKRTVYAAGKQGGKMGVWVDGKERAQFDVIVKNCMAFSPDSRRVGYAGTRGPQWWVEIDGLESKAYDTVMSGIRFSPDSRHAAYAVCRSNQWFAVLDGKESAPYAGIGTGSLTFSPDSRHFAFSARRGDKSLVVCDGRESQPYDELGMHGIVFGPDSRRMAFVAQQGTNWLVVVDGQASKPFQAVASWPFAFSDDSLHFGFMARTGGKSVLVMDEAQSAGYERVLVNSAGATNRLSRFQILAVQATETADYQLVRVQAEVGKP